MGHLVGQTFLLGYQDNNAIYHCPLHVDVPHIPNAFMRLSPARNSSFIHHLAMKAAASHSNSIASCMAHALWTCSNEIWEFTGHFTSRTILEKVRHLLPSVSRRLY